MKVKRVGTSEFNGLGTSMEFIYLYCNERSPWLTEQLDDDCNNKSSYPL